MTRVDGDAGSVHPRSAHCWSRDPDARQFVCRQTSWRHRPLRNGGALRPRWNGLGMHLRADMCEMTALWRREGWWARRRRIRREAA